MYTTRTALAYRLTRSSHASTPTPLDADAAAAASKPKLKGKGADDDDAAPDSIVFARGAS